MALFYTEKYKIFVEVTIGPFWVRNQWWTKAKWSYEYCSPVASAINSGFSACFITNSCHFSSLLSTSTLIIFYLCCWNISIFYSRFSFNLHGFKRSPFLHIWNVDIVINCIALITVPSFLNYWAGFPLSHTVQVSSYALYIYSKLLSG